MCVPIRGDFSLSELAILLNISKQSLWTRARAGKLPGLYRIGNVYRVRREALPELRGVPKPACGFCGTISRLNTWHRDGHPLCDSCAEAVDEERLSNKPDPEHISKPLNKVIAEIDADRKRKGSRR